MPCLILLVIHLVQHPVTFSEKDTWDESSIDLLFHLSNNCKMLKDWGNNNFSYFSFMYIYMLLQIDFLKMNISSFQ